MDSKYDQQFIRGVRIAIVSGVVGYCSSVARLMQGIINAKDDPDLKPTKIRFCEVHDIK